jgi:predicted dehydrogenase
MAAATMRPRLGFLGVGWIGRHRMQAILETGAVEAAAILDISSEAAEAASRLAPQAQRVADLDALLDLDLDGVVIASPSAAHAEQSIAALRRGVAVFCQKPLGRDAAEVAAVLDAARRADRLLGVDLSYRFTDAMRRIRGLVEAGELGRIYAVDLLFHNAYGPDKPWFYDPALSGGGCVMDLGVHLVDLALWTLGFPKVTGVSASLLAGGVPLRPRPDQVEDYASAMMTLADGATLRMACSWKLQAGCDAVISAAFHGTEGGAALRNIGGSFYDFVAERYRGTATETLVKPPDAWGGRAAADWATRLAAGGGFDAAAAAEHLAVAEILDRIYGR